jgi:hypothetical protein
MPLYHFELANGHRLPDPGGLECTGDEDAKAKAVLIARTMSAELKPVSGRHLVVLNESGNEIFTVPLNVDSFKAAD